MLLQTRAMNLPQMPDFALSLALPPLQQSNHQVVTTVAAHVLQQAAMNAGSAVTITPVTSQHQHQLQQQQQQHDTHQSHLRLLPTQPLPPEAAAAASITSVARLLDGGEPDDEEDLDVANSDVSTWVKCEFCEYRCPKKDRMSRHVRNVHYKEKPFGCSMCDACFGRKDKMKRHMATVHSRERPFKCDFCSHSSGRKDKIREHVQSVHYKNRPARPKTKRPPKKKKSSNSTQASSNNINPLLNSLTNATNHSTLQPHTIEMLSLPQQPLPPTHHLQQQQQHHMMNGGNSVHLFSAAGPVTLAQIPVSLVPVPVSAVPTHQQLKQHGNLIS